LPLPSTGEAERAGGPLRWTSALLFTAVNALFLAKYAFNALGPRGLAAPALYAACALALCAVGPRLLAGPLRRPRAFAVLAAALVALALAAVALTAGLELPVDRASAIVTFEQRLLHGDYPYAALTRLDHQISGFPGLFLLFLPLHLLGEVGLSQPLALLACALLLWRGPGAPAQKAAALLLLAGSPLFVWEVVVRSELLANLVLSAWLLEWTLRGERRSTRGAAALGGLAAGVLLTTRGIVLVPLLVFLRLVYGKLGRGGTLIAAGCAAASAAAILTPFVLWSRGQGAGSPLLVQVSSIPTPVLAASLCAALLLGLRCRSQDEAQAATGALLCAIVAVAFALFCARLGLTEAMLRSRFDLSYFAFALPFLLLSLYRPPDAAGPAR